MTLGTVHLDGPPPEQPKLGERLTLAQARLLAEAARAALEAGRDPGKEKLVAAAERRERLKDTFGRVLDDYFTTAVPLKKRRRNAGTTRKLIEKDCEDWLDRPISALTRADVRALLNGIVRRGSPVMANNIRAMLGPVFTWAWKQELITENPILAVDPPAEVSDRKRCPEDDELAEIWRATETLAEPWDTLGKVLMLTGQRLGAVGAMRWEHLHGLEGPTPEWRVPAGVMKMDADFVVPLASQVVAILQEQAEARRLMAAKAKKPERRALILSVPYVFWGGRVSRQGSITKPSGWSRFREAWRAAVDEARAEEGRDPMEDWRPHDFRRSMSSGLARLGIPLHVTELALDHRPRSIRGVAAVYQRYEFLSERRQALNLWANHVEALVNGKVEEKVVALHR